jgi:GTPase SAR1 family protein
MALAKEFNMSFFETSARSGHNVNESFFHIAKLIKDKMAKTNSANGATNNGSKNNGMINGNTRGSVLA